MANATAPPEVGMRRVLCVRVVVGGTPVRAEVVGAGDRLPLVRPVPLRVARALIDSGVPSVLTRRG
jgi:hypothetical protein